jgi:hypothetical protein
MTISSRLSLSLLLSLTACGGVASTPDPDEGPDAGEAPDEQPDASACAVDATVPGVLAVTADDRYRIWFNGELVDDAIRPWDQAQTYQVDVLAHPSQTNVIAIEIANDYAVDGYDRAGVVDLRYADRVVISDGAWKVSATAASGWQAAGFDDWAWTPAHPLGAMGIAPWYDVFWSVAPASTAQWIWRNDPSGAATDKPDQEVTYARHSFVVDGGCAL